MLPFPADTSPWAPRWAPLHGSQSLWKTRLMLPTSGLSSSSTVAGRKQSVEQLSLAHMLSQILTDAKAKLQRLLLSSRLWYWALQVEFLLALCKILISADVIWAMSDSDEVGSAGWSNLRVKVLTFNPLCCRTMGNCGLESNHDTVTATQQQSRHTPSWY